MRNSIQIFSSGKICDWYLGLGELHHIIADIVKQSEWVNSEPSILCSPDLVQELSQLQHTASGIHGDQDITVTAKGLHDIGWEKKNITENIQHFLTIVLSFKCFSFKEKEKNRSGGKCHFMFDVEIEVRMTRFIC